MINDGSGAKAIINKTVYISVDGIVMLLVDEEIDFMKLALKFIKSRKLVFNETANDNKKIRQIKYTRPTIIP